MFKLKLFIYCLKGSKPKKYKKVNKEKTVSHRGRISHRPPQRKAMLVRQIKVIVLLSLSIHTSLLYEPEAASRGGVHFPVTQIWIHPLTKRMWQTWPNASSQSRPRQALYASSFSSQKFAELPYKRAQASLLIGERHLVMNESS